MKYPHATGLILLLAMLSAATDARAQVVPIKDVWISNDAKAWSGASPTFDGSGEVFAYVQFVTDDHHGFQWNGSCVLALAANHGILHRERLEAWIDAGKGMVRTAGFKTTWPQAAVQITCVPDGFPGGAFSRALPHETSVAVPASPAIPPTPDPATGESRCKKALLEQGFSASYLGECVGVNGRCAEALLQSGQSPSYLQGCRDAEPRCAEALFAGGHDGSWVSGCRGVDPVCAETLLGSGRSASHLPSCR